MTWKTLSGMWGKGMVGVLFCVKVREGFCDKMAFEQRHEEGKVWLCSAEIWGEWVSDGRNCSAKALRWECAGSVGGTWRPRCGVGLRVGEEDGEGVEEGFPGVGDKNERGL